jgi:chaperonin cofactor prefoldin
MSNEDSNLFGWVLAGVASVIATLTTVVSFLFKSRIAAYEKAEVKLETRVEMLEQKLDKCESEHLNAKIELTEIKTRLNILEKAT